jgi:repressor of nif and glnA expression
VGLAGIVELGEISEAVCQVPVDLNTCGMVLLGGLNPVAAAAEAGYEASYRAMSTILPWSSLHSIWDL